MVFDINNVGVVQSVNHVLIVSYSCQQFTIRANSMYEGMHRLMDNASICYIIIENTYSMTNLVLSYHCKLRLVWVIV